MIHFILAGLLLASPVADMRLSTPGAAPCVFPVVSGAVHIHQHKSGKGYDQTIDIRNVRSIAPSAADQSRLSAYLNCLLR